MHRRLFAPTTPEATATLHVAGHRGGDDLQAEPAAVQPRALRGQLQGQAAQQRDCARPRRSRRRNRAHVRPRLTDHPRRLAARVGCPANTYPCATVPSATCWGTLTATGLPAGSSVTGFAPQARDNTGRGLNTGQEVNIDLRADAYGTVKVQLNLLCNNVFGVINPSVDIDATSVTRPPTSMPPIRADHRGRRRAAYQPVSAENRALRAYAVRRFLSGRYGA
jgi:hypothetical protein